MKATMNRRAKFIASVVAAAFVGGCSKPTQVELPDHSQQRDASAPIVKSVPKVVVAPSATLPSTATLPPAAAVRPVAGLRTQEEVIAELTRLGYVLEPFKLPNVD